MIDQTFPDWELWILENSTDSTTRQLIKDSGVLDDQRIRYEEINMTPESRAEIYPTARLLNQYYKEANGELIMYLSDDDLFGPTAAEVCVKMFDRYEGWDAAWFSLQHHISDGPGHTSPPISGIAANSLRTTGQLDGRVDGGQVVHTRAALDQLEWPWFPETDDPGINRHCDGLFLEKIAGKFPFHPIGRVLVHHRYTATSTWTPA